MDSKVCVSKVCSAHARKICSVESRDGHRSLPTIINLKSDWESNRRPLVVASADRTQSNSSLPFMLCSTAMQHHWPQFRGNGGRMHALFFSPTAGQEAFHWAGVLLTDRCYGNDYCRAGNLNDSSNAPLWQQWSMCWAEHLSGAPNSLSTRFL